MNFKNLIRNLILPERVLVKDFTRENLREIELKISECEAFTQAQIVFAYQVHNRLFDIVRGLSAREIAINQFKRLGIANTDKRFGILFYFILADKKFEIVTDDGIGKVISQDQWSKISSQISEFLKSYPINQAVIKGIELISNSVGSDLPAGDEYRNELSDKPIKIK